MSVFGQLSFVPDCLHYEHFLSLYQTEVLITATWYGCLLCFHCWLLCDQMLINCWQHKRCLLTLLFSGWIKAFFLYLICFRPFTVLLNLHWTHCRMSVLFLYCEITFNLLSTKTPNLFLQSSLWPICPQPLQLHGIIPSSTCKILHLPLINFGDFCWSASQNSSEWQPWSPYQPLDECHLQSGCGCIQRYYGRPCQKPW